MENQERFYIRANPEAVKAGWDIVEEFKKWCKEDKER
jgi:hypothetical protein